MTTTIYNSKSRLGKVNGRRGSQYSLTKEAAIVTAVHGFDVVGGVAVNAYVDASSKVTIPMGVIQKPVFDSHFPEYLNFGGLGVICAHELYHGLQFAITSVLKNRYDGSFSEYDNYTKELEAGDKINDCFVKQFEKYKVPIPAVNKSLPKGGYMGEARADAYGVKYSLMAYQDWIKENGQELSLPGLEFTPDKLLFISYAQMYCSNFDKQGRDEYL